MKCTVLFLTLFVLALPSNGGASETIRLTNGDWAPYLSKTMKHHGVSSHIVTEVFASMGVKTEYGFFPWSRAYKLAKDGDWHGSVVWQPSEERRKAFYFSQEPVLNQSRVFIHLADYAFDWKTIDDLAGIEIGGTIEYLYGEAFQKAEAEGKIMVERVPTDLINIRKLLKKRVDIIPMEKQVARHLIKTDFTPDEARSITFHPRPLTQDAYHLILSKRFERNKTLIKQFDEHFRKYKASGRYDQLMKDAMEGKYEN